MDLKEREYRTDYGMADAMAEVFGSKATVASFGENVGHYKRYFDKRKYVQGIFTINTDKGILIDKCDGSIIIMLVY